MAGKATHPMKQHRLKQISLRLGMALLIGLIGAGCGTGSSAAPSIDKLTAADVVRLAEVEQVLARLRDRYAVLGAGEAFLLDRLMPHWKAKAIPGKTALEELLTEVACCRVFFK